MKHKLFWSATFQRNCATFIRSLSGLKCTTTLNRLHFHFPLSAFLFVSFTGKRGPPHFCKVTYVSGRTESLVKSQKHKTYFISSRRYSLMNFKRNERSYLLLSSFVCSFLLNKACKECKRREKNVDVSKRSLNHEVWLFHMP